MGTMNTLTNRTNGHYRKYIIAVCGGLNWDMITISHRLPKNGETLNAKDLQQFPGGKGANTAIALQRLSHLRPSESRQDHEIGEASTEAGAQRELLLPPSAYTNLDIPEVQVRMIDRVGSDDFGAKMKTSLANHFVDVDLVLQVPGSSAIALVLVESELSENRIVVFPGANHILTPSDFQSPNFFGDQKPDMVVSQLEFHRETVAKLIATAKSAGIQTVLNPSPAHYLSDEVYDGLTHLVLNVSEAAILTGREVEEFEPPFRDWQSVTDEFIDLGVQHVVITLGAEGAFCSEKKGSGEFVPAVKVDTKNIKDTSGAGDTFLGGYLNQWIRQTQTGKWNIVAAVDYACKAAAQIIQEVGCQEAIPWASDIEPRTPPSKENV